MTENRLDVLVLGGGPAALSLAAACAREGLYAGCLAPDHGVPWRPTWGLWGDEADALGLGDAVADRWPAIRVRLDEARDLRIPLPYVRLDNGRLRERLSHPNVALLHGRAVARIDGGVRTEGGEVVRGRVVVDATGHGGLFVQHDTLGSDAAQVAYGVLAEVEGAPLPSDEMLWMDLSGPAEGLPSFLYAMPRGDGAVLLEETSLASRPPMASEELARRLQARLERMGIRIRRVIETERVHLPLDPPMPRTPQAMVAFGAAASFVHPTTGYVLARTLRAAEPVAHALAGGLGIAPEEASMRAWQAAWPPSARATRELHRRGLEVLLSLDAEGTRAFFEGFFSLPPTAWRRWMDPVAGLGPTLLVMSRVFARTRAPLRRTLMRGVALGTASPGGVS